MRLIAGKFPKKKQTHKKWFGKTRLFFFCSKDGEKGGLFIYFFFHGFKSKAIWQEYCIISLSLCKIGKLAYSSVFLFNENLRFGYDGENIISE